MSWSPGTSARRAASAPTSIRYSLPPSPRARRGSAETFTIVIEQEDGTLAQNSAKFIPTPPHPVGPGRAFDRSRREGFRMSMPAPAEHPNETPTYPYPQASILALRRSPNANFSSLTSLVQPAHVVNANTPPSFSHTELVIPNGPPPPLVLATLPPSNYLSVESVVHLDVPETIQMEQIARESQEWDRQWQHEIAYVLHRLFRLGLRMRERKFKPALRKRILKWMRRENVEATASPREEFSMIHVAILVPSLVATAPGRSWTQITQQSALNKAREILSSKESMREAMLLEGQEALDMVDLLDQTADVFSGIYRQRAMWLLSRLCKRCGLLPSSCCISEVLQRITRDPLFTGGFADVYRGQLGSRDVALKVLRVFGGSSGRNDVLKAFCKEAALWKRLRHPNVVPFLGVSTTAFEGRLCLLSPWLAHGHVRMYLEDHPDSNRLKFLLDVTLVLEYLHSLRVTHGDLKGVNILIDDDLRARLADFGLTVISSDPSVAQAMDVTTAMQEAGSTRWMAPELFDPSVPCAPNTASDIYALAMVFWEIFAGENPFPEMRMEPAVIQKVSRGDRPPRPLFGLSLGLSDPIWALMERCWQHQSALRPGVEEIVPIVQKAHAAFIPARATMPRKPDANDDRSSLDALFVDK